MPEAAAPYGSRRPAARMHAWRRAGRSLSQQVFLLGAAVAFFASAATLVVPQITALAHRGAPGTASVHGDTRQDPGTAPARGGTGRVARALSRAEVETVLSFALEFRPDDGLVQIQPGVYAKRSNVSGVRIGTRTVFYDVEPHQSYGPLRAGKLAESEVNVLAREGVDGGLVVIYERR